MINRVSFVFVFVFMALITGCSSKFTLTHDRVEGTFGGDIRIIRGDEGSVEDDEYQKPEGKTTTKKCKKTPATMRPYTIRGVRYYPTYVDVGDRFEGIASWYGPNFNGKKTSNGEIYDMYAMTAASKTLPMHTVVRVHNKKNNKKVVVRINDRGPFVAGRIIDLSNKAARAIDMHKAGTAKIELTVLKAQRCENTKKTKKTKIAKRAKQQENQNYSLQVASFLEKNKAIKFKNRVKKQVGGAYKTVIRNSTVGSKIYRRVFIDGFRSKEEAQDYKDRTWTNSLIVQTR